MFVACQCALWKKKKKTIQPRQFQMKRYLWQFFNGIGTNNFFVHVCGSNIGLATVWLGFRIFMISERRTYIRYKIIYGCFFIWSSIIRQWCYLATSDALVYCITIASKSVWIYFMSLAWTFLHVFLSNVCYWSWVLFSAAFLCCLWKPAGQFSSREQHNCSHQHSTGTLNDGENQW